VKINSYHSVKSLEEAYKLLNENKQNAIVAGGDLSELGIDQIVETEDSFEIGSMATLRQVEKHEGLMKHYDGALSNALSHIMGVPIRNVATIGGSIIGKYSFSDVLPPLLLMDVELEFYKKGRLSLEDFLVSKDRSTDILVKSGILKAKAEVLEVLEKAKEITEEVILETAEIAGKELKFGTNSKASESYRRNVAMAYIKRGLREVTV
jgi:putative selenate reductase FAD-binding subunit